jgi:hypothetical protein
MKHRLTGIVPVLFALNTSVMAASIPQQQEALLGLRVTSKGLSYYVYSGGCTKKDDFTVNVMESYPPQLQLKRLKADDCKGLVPDGLEIFYSWEELGLPKGMPFKVLNPLKDFVVPG